ncbi:hypothetical protein LCGC14_0523070 [marine sediment metagenome]|uniref:Uncharacterized protein n=1 Tax=marine sediment metagenome TaxID=412755 RepID=A0A0F9UJD4_9ZZZZ
MPRNTDTKIFDSGQNNKTGTHLSTNIIVLVEGNVIGAIQSMQVTEARGSIKMIDEIGTDGHIDSAPNAATNYNGTCTRVRFDRMRIAESFSRGFTHVKSQRIAFDIEIQDRFHDADAGRAIVTTIKNVWIERIGYTYSASDFIITDEMGWQAEDIYSVLNNNAIVGSQNAVGQPINLNSFESEADEGKFRGALDAPGLLDAFASDS